MRTLNKALCLVLAVVMIVGMFAFNVSAVDNLAGYTDGKDVSSTYKEAIDLLVGIKVVEGMGDGTLNLTGKYTRAQAATIVARIKLGTTGANNLKCVTAPFTDVSVDHWAAGAIAYCAQTGILDGLGDGSFDPEGTLTGYAFGKMLLCAVGYGHNGEYVGTGWEINVAKDGVKRKVYDKNDLGAATNDVITRQQAMLMAFNTLTKVNVVKFSTLINDYVNVNASQSQIVNYGGNVTSGSVDQDFLLTDNFKDIKLAAGPVKWGGSQKGYVVDCSDSRYLAYSLDDDTAQYSVESWFREDEVPVTVDYTMSGRIGRVWYNYKAVGNTIEPVTGFYVADTLLAESHDGTKLNELTQTSFSSTYKVTPDPKGVKYYVNGTDYTENMTDVEALVRNRGVSVSFYDYNKNGKADVVVIVAKEVAVLTSTPTVSADGKNITFNTNNYDLYGSIPMNKVIGYEGLAKDDIILFLKDDAGVYHIEKPDYVTGKVTRYTGNVTTPMNVSMVIGGETYKLSGILNNSGVQITPATVYGDIESQTGECRFYKDSYGYIIGVQTASEGSKDYVVLLNMHYAGHDQYLDDSRMKLDVYANLLKADGTQMDVKVKSFEYTANIYGVKHQFANYKNIYATYDGYLRWEKQAKEEENWTFKNLQWMLGYFFSYKGNATDGYTLNLIDNQFKYDAEYFAAQNQVKIIDFVKNGNPTLGTGKVISIKSDDGSWILPTYYANSTTNYLYYDYNGKTYHAATGVANAPTSKDAQLTDEVSDFITVMGSENPDQNASDAVKYAAKMVFLSNGSGGSSENKYFLPSIKPVAFIKDDPNTTVNEEGFVYKVLNGDKIEEVLFDEDFRAAIISKTEYGTIVNSLNDLTKPGWYTLELGGGNHVSNYVSNRSYENNGDKAYKLAGVGLNSPNNGIITTGTIGIDDMLTGGTVESVKANQTYSYTSDVKVYVIDPSDDYSVKIGGSELLMNDINDLVFVTTSSDTSSAAKTIVVVKIADPKVKGISTYTDESDGLKKIRITVSLDDTDYSNNYYYYGELTRGGEAVTWFDAVYRNQPRAQFTVEPNPDDGSIEGIIYTDILATKGDYVATLYLYDYATGLQHIFSSEPQSID